jgi:hypothetical protein
LKAKTSYRRRRTELIVERFEVGLEAERGEVESSIEALNEFEGCKEYNDSVDKPTDRMEQTSL